MLLTALMERVFPYLAHSLLPAGTTWIISPGRSPVCVKVYKFNDKIVYTVPVTEIEAHKSTVASHKFPVQNTEASTLEIKLLRLESTNFVLLSNSLYISRSLCAMNI